MDYPQMTGTNSVNQVGNINSMSSDPTWSSLFDPNSDMWNSFNQGWESFKDWIGKAVLKGAYYGPNGSINSKIAEKNLGTSIPDAYEASYGEQISGEPLDSTNESDYSDLYDVFKQALNMFNENVNKQYQFNHDEAELDRMFQKYMSDTSLRRQYSELKELGINPLLVLGQLGGASTPSGAQATGTLGNSNSLSNSLMNSIIGNKGVATALIGVVARIIAAIIGAKSTKNVNYHDDSSDWMKDWFN